MLSHIQIGSVPLAFRTCFGLRPRIPIAFRWLSSQPVEASNSGWQVSSFGRYHNLKKGVISRGHLGPSGYRVVQFAGYKWRVHRIVLITFKGLPPNQETWLVHHKDGDKANNRLDNLEYVTARQNLLHSRAMSGKTSRADSKPVMWRPVGLLGEWKESVSIAAAAEELGILRGAVSRCCHRMSSTHGYEIRFQDKNTMTLPGEEWRPMLEPVCGTELRGRMISSHGRVMSVRGLISRGYLTRMGYYVTEVCVNLQRRSELVHRLVAYTFLGPPSGSHRSIVNHKDFDKSNNAVDNLEWVSPAENIAHFLAESSASKRGKSVWSRRYGETDKWTWHASITSAQCALGIGRSAIKQCIAGSRREARGYEFQAAEQQEKQFLVGEVWRDIEISTLLQDRETRGF